MIEVTIDKGSGFCFGVVNAIQNAEKELEQASVLYCLGDLVHNNLEMDRLKSLGLETIQYETFCQLKNRTVLLRAHGEPPSTYALAKENQIKIIDATCPVVLQLQRKVQQCFIKNEDDKSQLVIFGKKGHAEVNGLVGQTNGRAIVIDRIEDLSKLDFHRNIFLFSQTTQSLDGFRKLVEAIKNRIEPDVHFEYFDTICRQVANRLPNIQSFAKRHDWVYFVAGRESSNGQMLFEECKKANPKTVFITQGKDITSALPREIQTVGVCGATSTPKWLMEEVAKRIYELNS